MDDETWKDIPGANGVYQVSTHGRVRRIEGRILKLWMDRDGYFRTTVTLGGKRCQRMVQGIVAMTFIGPRPDGYQVNHIDAKKVNNRPENLEYVTPKENIQHSWTHTDRKAPGIGVGHHWAKLSDTDVIRIRMMRSEGMTYNAIAENFNTKPANVWHICQGKTWTHLL